MAAKITVNKTIRIKINGVEYDSVEKVPPELRAIFEQARQRGQSVSLTFKGAGTAELPRGSQATPGDGLIGGGDERRVPLWVWAIAVASLAATLLYLAQRAG